MVSSVEMPWRSPATPCSSPPMAQTDENASPPLLGRPNQGAMVQSDAEASRRVAINKQQHQPGSANDDAADRKVEPLIVFDWDDTILTSSWIQVNDLLQATSYDELPPEVQRDLSQLERSVIKCLKTARRLGTVIIITNAESGWVELSAARFFVDVLPVLEGVPVISARSLFESQFPGSPLCWKSAAFAYMMHDHFLDRPQWVQKKVVSIGDSNEEKVAMRIASGQHGTMAAKAVKFITGPDPEALSCQLDFVTKNLASVISSDSDVDIVLDASMIHGNYSLPLHSRGVYDDQPQHQQQNHHHQQAQQPLVAAAPRPSSSSPASSSSFPCRDSSPRATAPSRPASSPQASSTTAAASPLETAPSSTVPSCWAPASDSSRDETAAPSSFSSSAAGRRARSESTTDGRSRSRSATMTSSSSSSSAPPSPQHLAHKRRASSSPIPIPPSGHGPGYGRGGGGAESGVGVQGVEGGGDCAQPFQPSLIEVGGPLSSSSSSSPSSPSTSRSAATAFENTVDPASSSAASSNSEAVAMALSSTSLVDGSRARGGSGGGPGARGGGRSPFGGGFPCPVDDGGGGGGNKGCETEKVGGVKAVVASTAAAMETERAVGLKESSPQKDHGRRGGLLSSGGGQAVDGMVGVVEAGTAVALDQAPKA